MLAVFLSSGLFLGWSLGANDAANVFGTAVGTKMLRFKTAALICSVFVLIGAVAGGAGAAHTLGKLGSVNALAGAFIVTFAAGFTVMWMTRLRLPVSTSQGIVGAIIGWNFFSGSLTDLDSLSKIISTWILCPLLAALFAMILFSLTRLVLSGLKVHLLHIDQFTRISLILIGAFGSYSLGANNIANVMGVFVPVVHFTGFDLFGLVQFSGVQLLFGLGGLAIAAGVFTYSHKVMETVGGSLLSLSPIAALIVVLSQALVLFLFSSEELEHFLLAHGMPAIPLVPVSSSQAVVGAVIGIGILKGGRQIKFKVLGEIAMGWITTPVAAGLLAFIALFFFQNVFNQKVYHKNIYDLSPVVISHLQSGEAGIGALPGIEPAIYENPSLLEAGLRRQTTLSKSERRKVIAAALVENFQVEASLARTQLDRTWFTPGQIEAVENLSGKTYRYRWQLIKDLQTASAEWRFLAETKLNNTHNRELEKKLEFVTGMFRVQRQ
jgi:PiT family inorganic phosphate transporter